MSGSIKLVREELRDLLTFKSDRCIEPTRAQVSLETTASQRRPPKRGRTHSTSNRRSNIKLPRQLTLLLFTEQCGKAHGCTTERWISEKNFYNHFRLVHLDSYNILGVWTCSCDSDPFTDAAKFMTHIWTMHMSCVPQPTATNGTSVVGGQLPPSTIAPHFPSASSSAVQEQPSSSPPHAWKQKRWTCPLCQRQLTLRGNDAMQRHQNTANCARSRSSRTRSGTVTSYTSAPLTPPPTGNYLHMADQMPGASRNDDDPLFAPTNNQPHNEPSGNFNFDGTFGSTFDSNFNGSFNGNALYWSEGIQPTPNTQIYPVTSATLPSNSGLPNDLP